MAVTIYDRDDRTSKYGVKWTFEGKRKFKFFKRKAPRDDFYKELVKKEKELGTALINLTAEEATIMHKCIDILGSPDKVLTACLEYASKINMIKCDSETAVNDFLAEKQSIGRNADYHRAAKNILSRFTLRFPKSISEWTADIAREWTLELTKGFEPVTVRNHIKTCNVFCKWCVTRKYLHENIFKDVPMPDIIRPEPEFLSVDAMKALFKAAIEHCPEGVAYLALGAFAGIRSSACARLELSSIDFNQNGILIRADQAKNKRRVYLDGHEDNLWKWLKWAREHAPDGFSLTKRQWDSARVKIASEAGVTMPHNALRHSFCTYHVALYGDAGKTATLLTHRGNVSILYEHYKGNASNAEAVKYFKI